MSELLEIWIHASEKEVDLSHLEEHMEPAVAEQIYELDRCTECSRCVAAALMRKSFIGAIGLDKMARFRLDPRDHRTGMNLAPKTGGKQ